MSAFEIDLSGEARWERLDIPTSFGGGRSFVSGEPDGDRLRIRYYRPAEGDRLVARAWFGPGAEGPPAHAHGGSAAAVLDEVMGTACWMTGHAVVAAQITIDFRAPVPLERVHTVEAWVDRTDGRKIHTVGRLLGDDGTVFSEGRGLFIEIEEGILQAFRESGLQQPGGEHFGTLDRREAAVSSSTVTLYRPTGPEELKLVAASGFKRWPSRLPGQPIFYPVTNEAYAAEIAEKWNVPESGCAYVTKFEVQAEFMAKYDTHQVGARHHVEWWIPANDLESLNEHIVGDIEVVREFGQG